MPNIVISLDETHHIKKGQAIYKKRFDKVQSFHFPPGYAPVKKLNRSFFIDINGQQVFKKTFINAFGFYSGIATVEDCDGFFHINENGECIHDKRFAWAGNFQEGACVVESLETNSFYHIDTYGNALYSERYLYVGDYKYGIAVAINTKGLCTHIKQNGAQLHGNFFLELDVYHKGYAIAKDEIGYFHINKFGQEQYSKRYAKIEPYYNGRALAVDHNGNKYLVTNNSIEQDIYKK